MHLKALGFPLNCCETRGYPGWFSDICILMWKKSMGTSHTIFLNGRKVVLREMSIDCPKAVWDLSVLHWAGSYSSSTCCPFFFFLVMSLGKVPPFYLVLVVPEVWTCEHYKVAVEWPQRLLCPTTNTCIQSKKFPLFCSLGSAITLGQHTVPGRAVVLMLLLSVLFYTHFFVVLLPIHSIRS